MHTVSKPIKISGIGMHSGLPANMVIKPYDKPGIFFKRTDLKSELISARYNKVGESKLQNTTVGDPNGAHVQTIEHLMAAFYIMGIDAALVEMNGPEMPILDGSAKQFCEMLGRNSKFEIRNSKKIIIKKEIIARRIEIIRQMPFATRMAFLINNFIKGRKSDGFVRLSPDNRGMVVDATLVYPDKIIGRQSAEFISDGTAKSHNDFIKNFAAARTFGSLHEWEWLKKRGMGRGANENNVIALNESGDGTLNPLRWADEFVRHKIIDILGDMYTSGGRIVGRVESYKGSHALNNLALRKLFADPENYEVIETEK
ncbi:MAG: UDP-3-O-acyl-N-acetylglucosamine deacetylase [Alphaproteobacteria bacterium]|nr:UDP-3-O-acyl-N-acetylglucosamine deacetylase [Alphaproteobacteria bacterium]MCL2889855.1 UDP-3-O-acyl-N-acetylglucosamine deacetylase [Alphaproteobacteria bacterium]